MFEGKGATASRRDILKGIGGTVAAAAAGSGLSGTATAAGEPIAIQYFHEDWSTITNDLDRVADVGFDAVWIQQPAEAALSENDQNGRNDPPLGYQPIDHRNFNSALGSESELRTLIDTAHSDGVEVYLDTVLNHMAAEPYSTFPWFGSQDFHNEGGIPQWSYTFDSGDSRCFENGSPKDPDRIECDPWWVENGDLLGLKDLDQDKPWVRDQLKRYMDKMADLGADGYRFDAAKHIDEGFFANYANQWAESNGMFRVGEVYSGSVEYVQGYVEAGPGMHAFDFPLYYVVNDVFSGGDVSRLEGAGLVAQNPGRAMPFVENHDVGAPSQYELAHAFVTTIGGYPMLYNLYPDTLLSNSAIRNMVWVKKNLAGGEPVWRYTGRDVGIYERKGNLLVGINNSQTERTRTVQTSWTSTDLNDFSGNAGNVTTDASGEVRITVPPEGWVFYAPVGSGSDTTPPEAAFSATPSDPSVGQTVDFDAGNSSDNEGITSYQWAFGDGASASGQTASHSYDDPGQYTVTLTVSDDAGNTGTATQTVTVSDTSAPTADAGSDRTVEEGTQVAFDAGGSSDNVGIDSYQWAFGDGTSAAGQSVTHTYADPGQYTVTLTVTDGAGNEDTDTVAVEVTADTPGTLPGGDGPPRSVDNDDLLEDVDGDGDFDREDVLTYYRNRERDAVRSNPEYFDFDGDGTAGSVSDALELYEELSN